MFVLGVEFNNYFVGGMELFAPCETFPEDTVTAGILLSIIKSQLF